MSPSSKGEGTKIAQAAKDLNVTSVTIRRYLAEFNIATTADENGVKVLPTRSMDELQEIRRLKEEGLTNPKVMEILEEQRSKSAPKAKSTKGSKARDVKEKRAQSEPEIEAEEEEEEAAKEVKPYARRVQKGGPAKGKAAKEEEPVVASEPEDSEELSQASSDSGAAAGRSKHSLTCQTCGKTFEHMNPRLRDCLDCYRTKRKERRRGGGGSDRHKNVIQHPLAQQAATKSQASAQSSTQSSTPAAALPAAQHTGAAPAQTIFTPRQSSVRNYRKAIEDTRHITSNLKRRLERPELPEGERRWLEQIYAYQLILHQGWRHLSEYKSANREQAKAERAEARGSESRSDSPTY